MVLCKYSKKDTAVFTSHLSLTRGIVMAARRAGLRLKLSEGFNPHPKIYMSAPAPVGTVSECEYFAADTEVSAKEFGQKINAVLQPGLEILLSAGYPLNPNFAGVSYAAEYDIITDAPIKLPDFDDILRRDEYEISFLSKGEVQKKEVRKLIFDLKKTDENKYSFTLACGNLNLRADRLMNYFLSVNGKDGAFFTVIKKCVFNKDFINFDELFFTGGNK